METEKISGKPSHEPRFRLLINKLAHRLAKLRANKNDSMEKVARACGITRGTVFKTENPGENEDLSMATVWSIAHHHGMTVDELLRGLDGKGASSLDDLMPGSPHLEKIDELALSLVPEASLLQFRADLAEAACLAAQNEEQLELLSKHSSRLRLKRYQLLIRQREHQKDEKRIGAAASADSRVVS